MSPKLFDLNDKVALVTGASRGIGEEIARTLAENGAHVIVSSRKQDACEVVAKSIRDSGGNATAFACHTGNINNMKILYDHIDSHHGKIDVLVNNAAASPYYGPILDTDTIAFDKTVEVNLKGYFFMSTLAGKRMKKNGGGIIINIASVNGISPAEGQGIYSITKAGVINMTKAFAKECAQYNIRVNAVLPGFTNTRLTAGLQDNDEIMNHYLEKIPLNRMAQPKEISGTVLYLASKASSYSTGSIINVDGGFLA